MKESDYINVSNLTKIRAATAMLTDILVMDETTDDCYQLREIIKECRSLEYSLRINCAITEEG